MRVRCDSGLMGWQGKLRKNYLSLADFKIYCEAYSIHKRLGYNTPEAAWKENPTIMGSVLPADFRKVK